LLIILALCGLSASGAKPLAADDLLLVYNDTDINARLLAKHYAEVRGVPNDRLCPLVLLRAGEEIAPGDFERLIRDPVRRYLEEHQLRDKVRCLVTFYGMPIRVGKRPVSPAHQKLLTQLRAQLGLAARQFEQTTSDLEGLAKLATRPASAKPPSENDLPELFARYIKAREAAPNVIAALPAGPASEAARRKWLETMEKTEGAAFVAASLQPAGGASDTAAAGRLEQVRQLVARDDARAKELLSAGLDSPSREEARRLVRQIHGLFNLLKLLQSDIQSIQPEETEAAVDSELMLLWWPEYPKYRWVANTLNWQQRAEAERRVAQFEPPWVYRTLMVSRIDAGSAAVARRMIDEAVAVEKTGLTGKVYIDARGFPANNNYGKYDEDLRRLGRMLKQVKSLSVTVDDRPGLFQPGQCPQTMLYCGWYSLRKYVPAFTFVPGAVGFHIGSFEAASLKGTNEMGWCKRMLDNGVDATLGPVAEPYLHSFPLPSRFFGLLATGRYTLAECYAYTLPLNSWMQMLLGDPLYRPFARKPLLTVEQVYESQEIPKEFREGLSSRPESAVR